MTPWEMLAVLAAGFGAGAVNAVVGSGTLLTFPVLLAVGLSPVTAIISNALGLIPGSLGAAFGYRTELVGQRRRLLRLGVGAALGGVTGATLLLTLPASAIQVVVPVLVAVAVLLVAFQPLVITGVRRLRRGRSSRPDGGPLLWTGITLASVYGGYFAAAQGIVYVAIAGVLLDETPHRLNAAKNVLVATVNTAAATLYLLTAHPVWPAVALLAAGSTAGGLVAAGAARRLGPRTLRAAVVLIGTTALVQLLLS